MRIDRSAIRRAVIREMYNTSLMQIFEQAPPADPAAAAAATPPADPAAAAATPPADPAAAAAATPPADPAAAAAAAAAAPVDPAIAAAGAAGAAAPAVPPVDPTAALAAAGAAPAVPGAAPAAPAVPGAAPAAPGAAPAAPGAAPGTPGAAPGTPGAVPPPAPKATETGKQEVFKALMTSTADAEAEAASESFRRRSLRVLFEQEKKEEPKINMDMFAEKIANLIKNYTSLVDVKKNVIDQADSYLKSQFPDNYEDLSKKLKDLLRRQYRITLERPEPPPDSYAVGAKGGGGGAA